MKIKIILCVLILGVFISACTTTNPPAQQQPTSQTFCGWATNASCTYTSDCMAGGCSGQVCGGKNEEMVTTCEYTDCYNAAKYNASCVCIMGKCGWAIRLAS